LFADNLLDLEKKQTQKFSPYHTVNLQVLCMNILFRIKFFAALSIALLLIFTTPVLQANQRYPNSGSFYAPLSRYGNWVNHPVYGQSWFPRNVNRNWRPYANGYWANSIQFGLTWESSEPWGWATYHYGRWAWDDWYGWLWIPGNTWAPAWVLWRSGGDYVGWAPMPPTVLWSVSVGLNFGYFNYDRDMYRDSWVMMRKNGWANNNRRPVYYPVSQNQGLINNTTFVNQTNVYQTTRINNTNTNTVNNTANNAVNNPVLVNNGPIPNFKPDATPTPGALPPGHGKLVNSDTDINEKRDHEREHGLHNQALHTEEKEGAGSTAVSPPTSEEIKHEEHLAKKLAQINAGKSENADTGTPESKKHDTKKPRVPKRFETKDPDAIDPDVANRQNPDQPDSRDDGIKSPQTDKPRSKTDPQGRESEKNTGDHQGNPDTTIAPQEVQNPQSGSVSGPTGIDILPVHQPYYFPPAVSTPGSVSPGSATPGSTSTNLPSTQANPVSQSTPEFQTPVDSQGVIPSAQQSPVQSTVPVDSRSSTTPAQEMPVQEAIPESTAVKQSAPLPSSTPGDTPVTAPVQQSMPEPQPVQQSMPEPQPVQQSMPEPQPVQQLMPEPQPVQQSMPEPQPVQQSMPEPQPVQQSMPEPQPVQQSMPEPQPVQQSMPEPQPVQQSMPEPQPVQQSMPEPAPAPPPAPEPAPAPQPAPEPAPAPQPAPEPAPAPPPAAPQEKPKCDETHQTDCTP
jgi:hypothetical protein